MPEKTYRPKSGNEGLTVEFPGAEGFVTVRPSDWPYKTSDAGEQAYFDNLDEVTDRQPPKRKTASAGASRSKKGKGADAPTEADGAQGANADGHSGGGNDDGGGEG